MQRLQRQLNAQVTAEKGFASLGFCCICEQFVFNQGGISFTDVDIGNQFFQVGRRHPFRDRAAIGAPYALVTQRHGYQVLKRKVGQRKRHCIDSPRDGYRAQNDRADDADFYVLKFDTQGFRMVPGDPVAQCLQRKSRQCRDVIQEGLSGLLLAQ